MYQPMFPFVKILGLASPFFSPHHHNLHRHTLTKLPRQEKNKGPAAISVDPLRQAAPQLHSSLPPTGRITPGTVDLCPWDTPSFTSG